MINIEYSIVSRGTEKYNNKGYMAISEIKNSYRYILNVDHGIKKSVLVDGYLKAKSIYSIYNVVFSRFELITSLMFNRYRKNIKDNILILGSGNLSIGCLFYLLDNNYRNISLYVREKNDRVSRLLNILLKEYKININVVTSFCEKYDTYIDTTGSSSVLKDVFESSKVGSTIAILSTPRDEEYLFSPLIINRKSLCIIGSHEFNNVDSKYRQKMYNMLLKKNMNKEYLKDFINIYEYSSLKLKSIKENKNNFIEIFKY